MNMAKVLLKIKRKLQNGIEKLRSKEMKMPKKLCADLENKDKNNRTELL